MIKVRAVRQGVHAGNHIDVGTIFQVEEVDFANIKDPDPVKAQFGWMELAEEKEASKDHRAEPRDEGEKDQHAAEKKGWA